MHIIRLFSFLSHTSSSVASDLHYGQFYKEVERFLKISGGRKPLKKLECFTRIHAPLWNFIFSSFSKPTNDELVHVVHCQYMAYHRFCLEYFHRGLQLLEMFKQTDCDLWPDCWPLAGASLSRRLLVYT